MKNGLGERIREVRKQLGAGQKDFGEILGVSPSAISSYEREEKTPPVETLERIADLGHVTLDWLIKGKGTGPGETVNENEPRYQHTLDEHLVATAMATIQQIEALFNQPIRPEKKAKLFCVIYRAEQNNETVRITDLAEMLQDAQ